MKAIFRVGAARGRDITRRDGDAPDWDALVARILGPRLAGDDTERRRADALALAEAAQRAAGVERMPG